MKQGTKALLWVYAGLFLAVITLYLGTILTYTYLATTTKQVMDAEAFKSAVNAIGVTAEKTADMVEFTLGAVLGALSATLQQTFSARTPQETCEKS